MLPKTRLPLTAAALLSFLAALPATAVAQAGGKTVALKPDATTTTVTVYNSNNLDVDVIAAIEDGKRVHLGRVRASTARQLRLPGSVADGKTPFRLRMYTILEVYPGSSEVRYVEAVKTRVLVTNPGDELTLIIEEPLALSYISQ